MAPPRGFAGVERSVGDVLEDVGCRARCGQARELACRFALPSCLLVYQNPKIDERRGEFSLQALERGEVAEAAKAKSLANCLQMVRCLPLPPPSANNPRVSLLQHLLGIEHPLRFNALVSTQVPVRGEGGIIGVCISLARSRTASPEALRSTGAGALGPPPRGGGRLGACPGLAQPFASTQAAWRFWANPRTDLKTLAGPLIEAARAAVPTECLDYALVVHDWSNLHYKGHPSKEDRIALAHAKDLGYELQTALLLSDQDGQPLAPLCQDLLGAQGVYSTRRTRILPPPTKLDRLAPVLRFVHDLKLGRPAVHIIDREADSVDHYRRWSRQGRLFLIRADDNRRVRYRKQSRLLPEVVAELQTGKAFRASREVLYHGVKAWQWVAEAAVVLDRPARQQHSRIRKPGKALRVRLVVAQVRDATGAVLAQWLLFTNVPAEVSAERVALWYYWRWRIESSRPHYPSSDSLYRGRLAA